MQTQLGAEFVCIVSGLQEGKWYVDSPGLLLQAVWPQAPAECCLLPALALFVRQRGFHNPPMMVGLPLVLSLAVYVVCLGIAHLFLVALMLQSGC